MILLYDLTCGSAGLLVAAMNEMIIDAKRKIKSPLELEQKILNIKSEQLLGLEVLSNIYISYIKYDINGKWKFKHIK